MTHVKATGLMSTESFQKRGGQVKHGARIDLQAHACSRSTFVECFAPGAQAKDVGPEESPISSNFNGTQK